MSRVDSGNKLIQVKEEVHYRLKLWAAIQRLTLGQAVAELLDRAEKHEQETRNDSGV